MATDTRDQAGTKSAPLPALRRGVWFALAFVMLWGGLRLKAQDAPPLENQVKAAFLVKFALFVEWPAAATNTAASEPFTIGILGSDPFGKNFDDAIKGEKINGRPVRLRRGRELADLADCPEIFICASESKRMAGLLRGLEGKPVLTVSDGVTFAKSGGMIGFIKEGGKLRFEINAAAAERAGLKLSAKLLQVAKNVAGCPTHPGEQK